MNNSDIDYGRCRDCNTRFYTYVKAWEVYNNVGCTECGSKNVVFTSDFWNAIYASYFRKVGEQQMNSQHGFNDTIQR